MSEILPIWFERGNTFSPGPEDESIDRKIVSEIPGVGHSTIMIPAKDRENDPHAELIDFQLDGAYSLGEGPDTLLAEEAMEAASVRGALILNISLFDFESSWFLQSFRTVPPSRIMISERTVQWDPANPDKAVEYGSELLENKSLSWVQDQLKAEQASDNTADLDDPEVPERYLVQIVL